MQPVVATMPLPRCSNRRAKKMTKASCKRSEGRKNANEAGETVLAWIHRWTVLVSVMETKITEKQKGMTVANMMKMMSDKWKKPALEDVTE